MHLKRGTKFALAVLTWLVTSAGAHTALAASGTGLTYYGGPVAHSMNVILVDWGPAVRSTYTDTTTGDPAFFTYLAGQSGSTNDIGGVLAQYMDTSGTNSQNQFRYGGLVQITPPASGSGGKGCSLPSCVSDSQIQSTLQSSISSGALPTPPGSGLSTIYVVLFPPNTNVCDGSCAYSNSGFCAYHSSFQLPSSTQVLYAAIVDNGPGTPNYGLCGPGSNDLANQTDVVSHEFAETVNDPLVAESGNTFGPPLAWYNSAAGEIGDICVGSGEQAQNGSWTVQKIWSNLDGGCVAGESSYTAPTASFLAPLTSTSAEPVTFDASNSSDPSSADTYPMTYAGISYSLGPGIASYQWDWGDGSPAATSSSASATHTYTANGNYNVSLTVTDNLGFTSTITREISIAGAPPQPPATRTVAAAPSVTTGHASNVTSTTATIAGTVNPNGGASSYHVEYGSTPAYGQSTVAGSAGSGDANLPVSVVLTGLHPKTTYHYRLVATSSAGTSVGTDATFSTGKALRPAPRFSYKVVGRPTVAAALARGLKLRFVCSKACLARFTVMIVPRRAAQLPSSLVTVAAGHRRTRARTWSTATLTFIPKARRRLAGQRSLKLLLSGYASSAGSQASSPQLAQIKLNS